MAEPPPPMLEISPAKLADARAFSRYVAKHVAESGRDGSAHFALSPVLAPEDVELGARERWSRPLDEPLWGRAWLLWAPPPEPRLVGHVELRGGRVPSEMHRAVLAMGMLRPYVGKGHGRRLLETAIAWARSEAGLAYIDLGVFSQNERARRLYTSAGFVTTGVREDAFRIDGVLLHDVQMTLALGALPPARERP